MKTILSFVLLCSCAANAQKFDCRNNQSGHCGVIERSPERTGNDSSEIPRDKHPEVKYTDEGDEFAAKGQVGQAMNRYKAAIQANPNYGRAHWNLALVYIRAGIEEEGSKEKCFDGRQLNSQQVSCSYLHFDIAVQELALALSDKRFRTQEKVAYQQQIQEHLGYLREVEKAKDAKSWAQITFENKTRHIRYLYASSTQGEQSVFLCRALPGLTCTAQLKPGAYLFQVRSADGRTVDSQSGHLEDGDSLTMDSDVDPESGL